MKTQLTLLLAFFCSLSYSQEKHLAWQEKTCEEGTVAAEKDFGNGRYFCDCTERFEDENVMFARFYKNYLKEKYGILSVSESSIVNEYDACYSQNMEKMIFEKFGLDIFEKSLKEARKLYSER